MKICYQPHPFRTKSLALIEKANAICEDYAARGYTLTLRQGFYRLVAANVIPNTFRSYKNTGETLKLARLAGLIDWDHLVDRGRFLRRAPNWESPAAIIRASVKQFQQDLWREQPAYCEVAVEKDALVDIVGGAATAEDVGYFSCRGYDSTSDIWRAAMRLLAAYRRDGKACLVVFHLADHDPSGLDMTRDLEERLRLFLHHHEPAADAALEVRRLALTHAQVVAQGLPENPLKTDPHSKEYTDVRAKAYVEAFGTHSWELDALDPAVLTALIQGAIEGVRDDALWKAALAERERQRALLGWVADRWSDVEYWARAEQAEAGEDGEDGEGDRAGPPEPDV